jgi:pimeloyl-ACP methyl ester carboxylesterase
VLPLFVNEDLDLCIFSQVPMAKLIALLTALFVCGPGVAQEVHANIYNLTQEQIAQLAYLAPPPQLSTREPLRVETVPCLPSLSPGEGLVEGDNFTCGIFTVPQNWKDHDSNNVTTYIDLSFMIVRAPNPSNDDPLVYLEGGPGASAVLDGSGQVLKFAEVQQTRDILLLDIRGVGQSQRLDPTNCLVVGLLNNATNLEAVAEAANSLISKLTNEPGNQLAVEEMDIPALNDICWKLFTAQGIEPNHFHTAHMARDVVEFVQALGYTTFNIYSVSYGTRLAMTILNSHLPTTLTLRSVVLDSAFPPSVYLVRTLVRSDHEFLVQLLDECQADAVCSQHYPNIKQRLELLLLRLEQEPIEASEETVTLEQVVKMLKDVGGTRAGYFPKMIDELEHDSVETYQALRDQVVGQENPEPPVEKEDMAIDSNDPVEVFVAEAAALLDGSDGELFTVSIEFAFLEEDILEALQVQINDLYGDTEVGEQMLQMAENLTEEDIVNSPYVARIQAKYAALYDPEFLLAKDKAGMLSGQARLLYTSVHCIDDILHERFEDAVNSYNDLLFPQLTDLVKSKAQAGRCENWPVDAAPIQVKDPVNSTTIPVLILQGAYDKPTPVYMGRRAARELKDGSTYVLVPQEGHGTWTSNRGCVGEIGNTFILNPEKEVNRTCLEARKPQWALPTGTIFVTDEETKMHSTTSNGNESEHSSQTATDTPSSAGAKWIVGTTQELVWLCILAAGLAVCQL